MECMCPNTTKESNAITVSLETAKKLRSKWRKKDVRFLRRMYEDEPRVEYYEEWYEWFRWLLLYAPTAQEILDELPMFISFEWKEFLLTMFPYHNEYWVVYEKKWWWAIGDVYRESLAEWLAEMWIRCKENKYID